MSSTRRHVIAASTVLLLMFAVGVFFLVRLGMAASSNADTSPISSSDAAPGAGGGDSDVTDPDMPGVRDEHGDPEFSADSSTGPADDAEPDDAGPAGDAELGDRRGNPEPGKDSSPTSVADGLQANNSGAQPPRPAVPISPTAALYIPIFSGDGAPPLRAGETFNLAVSHTFHFSIPARVVEVGIRSSEPGNPLVLARAVTGEQVTECGQGVTAEPGEYSAPPYLCTVGVRISESAAPGRHEGRVILIFEATCTSKIGAPCASLPDHYAPSPDKPVDITFIADHFIAFEKTAQP